MVWCETWRKTQYHYARRTGVTENVFYRLFAHTDLQLAIDVMFNLEEVGYYFH
jgi:hypothetical protein